jgi:hypothetical protein
LLQFLATTTYCRSQNPSVDPFFVDFRPFASSLQWGKASTKSIMQHRTLLYKEVERKGWPSWCESLTEIVQPREKVSLWVTRVLLLFGRPFRFVWQQSFWQPFSLSQYTSHFQSIKVSSALPWAVPYFIFLAIGIIQTTVLTTNMPFHTLWPHRRQQDSSQESFKLCKWCCRQVTSL